LLSRRYLAAAVLAAGLATAAVPAVAATPSTTPSPTATASQSAAPTKTAPAPVKAIKLPNGLECVISVDRSGRGVVEIKPGTKVSAADAAVCRKLLAAKGQLPFPKGAPQTGGGGMAAEVSSWG
jgi:glucose/arabinose dehydrogenase